MSVMKWLLIDLYQRIELTDHSFSSLILAGQRAGQKCPSRAASARPTRLCIDGGSSSDRASRRKMPGVAALLMRLKLLRDQPLQQQLYDQLRELIASARLQSGTRKPSTRLMAEQFAISRVTVLLQQERCRHAACGGEHWCAMTMGAVVTKPARSARALCSRVRLAPYLHEPPRLHAGVALRRGQAGVPQQVLDRSQIGSALQQMRRERVT